MFEHVYSYLWCTVWTCLQLSVLYCLNMFTAICGVLFEHIYSYLCCTVWTCLQLSVVYCLNMFTAICVVLFEHVYSYLWGTVWTYLQLSVVYCLNMFTAICVVLFEHVHSYLCYDGSWLFISAKGRRQPKAVKPKKMIRLESKNIVYAACNNGSSAVLTKDGALYMFGKDTSHCHQSNGTLTF